MGRLFKEETKDSRYEYRVYSDKSPGTVLMGYEYENQVPESTKLVIPKAFNQAWEAFCYNTGAAGYEFRSCVAPLEFHRRVWQRYFNNGSFPFNRNKSYEPSLPHEGENAFMHGGGIHVSVSKNKIGKDNFPAVFDFLNTMRNRPMWKKLSGRSDFHFNLYVAHHNYQFIRNNENRYEMRLFTAHPDILVPALEFADSIFRYSDHCAHKGLAYDPWRGFVEASERYPALLSRLHSLEI